MRRWFALIVVATLFVPGMATAQDASPTPVVTRTLGSYLPTGDAMGDDWSELYSSTDNKSDTVITDRAVRIYGGPNGARLRIIVFALPERISDRAEVWTYYEDRCQAWANYYADTERSGTEEEAVPFDDQIFELPDGVSDGIRYNNELVLWEQQVGVALYALDAGPGVFMILEGAFHRYSGLKGTDAIVSLIVQGL